jgi:hypothetical protein
MPLLTRLRRATWLSGAVLLLVIGLLVAPAAYRLGTSRWPLLLGLAAMLVLLAGWVETAWRSRPQPRRRWIGRSRLRLVTSGKGRDKGNGHAADLHDPPDDDDKPRWVM